MNVRSQFIKVRVNRDEHGAIQKRADAQGLTISEYVRATVATVHERLDVVEALNALRTDCQNLASPRPTFGTIESVKNQEAYLLESVLVLREIAAARDVQILSRVRAQLKQKGVTQTSGGSLI